MNQDTAFDATRADSGIAGDTTRIGILDKAPETPALGYHPEGAGRSISQIRNSKILQAGRAPLLNTGQCS